MANQAFVMGRNQRFYSARDTTAMSGSFTAPTQAAKMLRTSVAKKTELTPRMDARQTADVLETIQRMTEANFEFEPYVIPSGTAGTAPDIDPILLSVFGSRTIVGGTSVTYAPDDRQVGDATHGTHSFSALREYNSLVSQQMIGCWADALKIALKGGDEPKFTISGGCQNVKTTGNAALTGNALINATTINVSTTASRQFYAASSDNAASTILVGTDTTVQTVTAVNYATGAITISPGLGSGQSTGASVYPSVPTETTLGSPISFTQGSLTIDGSTSFLITQADIEFGNQINAFKDIAFAQTVPDYTKNFRKVGGTLTLKARQDAMGIICANEQIPQTSRAVTLVCGTTAGRIMTINLPQVVIFEAELDVPETMEGHLKVPFLGLGTSNTSPNSMSIVFT